MLYDRCWATVRSGQALAACRNVFVAACRRLEMSFTFANRYDLLCPKVKVS